MASGHIHWQDNEKIVKDAQKSVVLVEEKGKNDYKRVSDSQCEEAKKYWDRTAIYWEDVQSVWDMIKEQRTSLQIKGKVNNKIIWERMFELEEELLNKPYQSSVNRLIIKKEIEAYL